MASTRLTITLTPELLEFVRERSQGGDYNNDSEVIRDGLRLLKARDQAVEEWLRKEVVPAHLRLKADPSRAMSADDVSKQLAERRKARKKHPA
ncbi:type II toxin-antitoxin system ParD family antitoxin [Paraburkholderia sp. Tr-20389]|uniref:type II toxin-antitoxin system ParD family antitoxin n=1 Tax=Paraburkholderia sp. Tr-20389 TaxID=2703903 RepID=UPI0019822974|nr:type II toxin-antitoxin system ParD family antitoxin [Paraburkholderia sp. Tr-20389]